MAKKPSSAPKEGDRVKLKGRDAVGVLREILWANNWCLVDWDRGHPGPKIVHLYELANES